MRIRGLGVAAITLATQACSPMYLAARPPVDVSHYRGDGTIERVPHPINPGFLIDFPAFPMTAPYEATYRLEGLPKPRHESPYELGLALDLMSDEESRWPKVPAWLTTGSPGSIQLRVTSASGALLLDLRAPLAGLTWRRPAERPLVFAVLRGEGQPGGVGARLASDVAADQIPSAIEIAFIPGAGTPARSAWVRLAAGGED